jgi:hypothetical protein
MQKYLEETLNKMKQKEEEKAQLGRGTAEEEH